MITSRLSASRYRPSAAGLRRIWGHRRAHQYRSLGISWHHAPVSTHNNTQLLPTEQNRFFSSSSPAFDFEEPPEKSIEEQYSKKTPLEHVLLRPGMYVGPVGRNPPNDCWVLEPTPQPFYNSPSGIQTPEKNTEVPYRMVHKEYGLIPALIKIFDEILVNASDNRLRSPKSCTKLDVQIDPGAPDRDPCIRIWNNGRGIPVEVSFVDLRFFNA